MKLFRILINAFIFPFLVFVFHILLYFLGIYELYAWIDIPMHFLGGFSIAFTYIYLTGFLYRENIVERLPFLIFFVFIISLVSLTAVLWEFFEFGIDIAFNLDTQKGVKDTLGDLLFGLIGGSFGFLLFKRYPKARR